MGTRARPLDTAGRPGGGQHGRATSTLTHASTCSAIGSCRHMTALFVVMPATCRAMARRYAASAPGPAPTLPLTYRTSSGSSVTSDPPDRDAALAYLHGTAVLWYGGWWM